MTKALPPSELRIRPRSVYIPTIERPGDGRAHTRIEYAHLSAGHFLVKGPGVVEYRRRAALATLDARVPASLQPPSAAAHFGLLGLYFLVDEQRLDLPPPGLGYITAFPAKYVHAEPRALVNFTVIPPTLPQAGRTNLAWEAWDRVCLHYFAGRIGSTFEYLTRRYLIDALGWYLLPDSRASVMERTEQEVNRLDALPEPEVSFYSRPATSEPVADNEPEEEQP